MALGRNHSTSTSNRFYERKNLNRSTHMQCAELTTCCSSADAAAEHLNRLRQKRRAEAEPDASSNNAPPNKKVKVEVKTEEQVKQG